MDNADPFAEYNAETRVLLHEHRRLMQLGYWEDHPHRVWVDGELRRCLYGIEPGEERLKVNRGELRRLLRGE